MKSLFWNTTRSQALMLALIITGCGGSGEGGGSLSEPEVTIASGRFVDSAVAGLSYRSGSVAGVTDALGTFEYEVLGGVPQLVLFAFNNVEIGATQGRDIVTPLDLVTDSSINALEVQNIARFLQMLDTDANPSNGISPSMDLMSAVLAFSWNPVDFYDADFSNQSAVTQIIADVSSVDTQPHILPSAAEATQHLKQTVACHSSGIFSGRFSGADAGHFVLWIQHQRVDPASFGDTEPHLGVTSAYVYSSVQDRLIGVSPQEGLSFNSSNGFVAGRANNGAEFSGSLTNYNAINDGTWRNDVEGGQGAFSGTRVAGDTTANYRLSGAVGVLNPVEISPDRTGAIALDVFADNRVAGEMVTSRGDRYPVAGELQGDAISVISSTGMALSLVFDASGTHGDNHDVGLFGLPGFWGSWQLGSDAGVVIGSSCRLNQ
ncbi:MAG: hypothetical protein D9N11_01425 [Ketobacter sp.]|nr:MAG: hypothetical protein D9N11_01425 [Ketobacter sp.]